MCCLRAARTHVCLCVCERCRGYYIIERRCGLGEDMQFTCSSGGATAAQRTLEDSDGSGLEKERVGPNFYFLCMTSHPENTPCFVHLFLNLLSLSFLTLYM